MTWATSVPILVFLGLSVLDLGSMYATDRRQTSDRRQTDKRQTDVRQKHRLMPPPIRGGGIIIFRTQQRYPLDAGVEERLGEFFDLGAYIVVVLEEL